MWPSPTQGSKSNDSSNKNSYTVGVTSIQCLRTSIIGSYGDFGQCQPCCPKFYDNKGSLSRGITRCHSLQRTLIRSSTAHWPFHEISNLREAPLTPSDILKKNGGYWRKEHHETYRFLTLNALPIITSPPSINNLLVTKSKAYKSDKIKTLIITKSN